MNLHFAALFSPIIHASQICVFVSVCMVLRSWNFELNILDIVLLYNLFSISPAFTSYLFILSNRHSLLYMYLETFTSISLSAQIHVWPVMTHTPAPRGICMSECRIPLIVCFYICFSLQFQEGKHIISRVEYFSSLDTMEHI